MQQSELTVGQKNTPFLALSHKSSRKELERAFKMKQKHVHSFIDTSVMDKDWSYILSPHQTLHAP